MPSKLDQLNKAHAPTAAQRAGVCNLLGRKQRAARPQADARDSVPPIVARSAQGERRCGAYTCHQHCIAHVGAVDSYSLYRDGALVAFGITRAELLWQTRTDWREWR